jgi:predicted short-subunit dehydrogenase-like oxidoreductase (DUF2520 family)
VQSRTGATANFLHPKQIKQVMLSRWMAETVSIVGAGRVGRTLGRCLRELGWQVGAVLTRRVATSRAAARAIGAGTPQVALSPGVLAADVVLLTTPDGELRRTAERLAQQARERCRGAIILHTSGALDRSPLAALARMGAWTGSLHPMQTFSGRADPNFQGVIFAVEGERRAQQAARRIARALGGVPIRVGGESKPAYHAAGALVSGHALALVEAATEILLRVGFTRKRALEALLPLMRQMLDNFEELGPQASWTGPIARGDYAIVQKHADALRRYPREFEESYAALALLGGRVLSKTPARTIRQIKRALKNPSGGWS